MRDGNEYKYGASDCDENCQEPIKAQEQSTDEHGRFGTMLFHHQNFGRFQAAWKSSGLTPILAGLACELLAAVIMRWLRFDRIFMVTVLLALSIWFFSMSDPLSPYTLITIPVGVIFFFGALGAVFGQPDRGARTGIGMLAAFLGILAITKNVTVALAITFGVALAACAFMFWRRKRLHGIDGMTRDHPQERMV